MHEQIDTLIHGMGDVHPTELKVRLCERLSELTFERWGQGDGKVAAVQFRLRGGRGGLEDGHAVHREGGVLSFTGGYHGLGYGALMAGGFEKFRSPFASQFAGVGVVLPFDLDAVSGRACWRRSSARS